MQSFIHRKKDNKLTYWQPLHVIHPLNDGFAALWPHQDVDVADVGDGEKKFLHEDFPHESRPARQQDIFSPVEITHRAVRHFCKRRENRLFLLPFASNKNI